MAAIRAFAIKFQFSINFSEIKCSVNTNVNTNTNVRTMCHSIFSIPLETFPNHGVVKLCGIQREQIFFTAKCLCNILYTLVELMPKVASVS